MRRLYRCTKRVNGHCVAMEVVVGDVFVAVERGEVALVKYVDKIDGEWKKIEDYIQHGDFLYIPTPLHYGCDFLKVDLRTPAAQCIEEPEE